MGKILIGIALTAAVGGAIQSPAAWGVTAAEVSATCGSCHGLSVNGVVVASGPGSFGFTAYVSGRDQITWTNTIARMVSHGAVVSDPNGTAAFLAGLGSVPPTPTLAPPPTPTPGLVSGQRTPPVRHGRPPHHPQHPGRRHPLLASTPTATPTPTETPDIVSVTGSVEYQTLCARCHEPSSPGFVGQTVHGASQGDITEALSEVPQMQFLRSLLDLRTIQDLAAYLGGSSQGGDNGGTE